MHILKRCYFSMNKIFFSQSIFLIVSLQLLYILGMVCVFIRHSDSLMLTEDTSTRSLADTAVSSGKLRKISHTL